MASQTGQQSLMAARPIPENCLRLAPPEIRRRIWKLLAELEVVDTYDLPNILLAVDSKLYEEALPTFKHVFLIQKYTVTTDLQAELLAMPRARRLAIKHLKLVDPSPTNLTNPYLPFLNLRANPILGFNTIVHLELELLVCGKARCNHFWCWGTSMGNNLETRIFHASVGKCKKFTLTLPVVPGSWADRKKRIRYYSRKVFKTEVQKEVMPMGATKEVYIWGAIGRNQPSLG